MHFTIITGSLGRPVLGEAVSMMRPVHGRPTTMAARVHAVASPSSRMMSPSTNCLYWAVEGSGPRRQGRAQHCSQGRCTGAGFVTRLSGYDLGSGNLSLGTARKRLSYCERRKILRSFSRCGCSCLSFTRSRARGRARAQLGSCSRSPGSSPLGAGGSAGPSCLACVARSLRRLA